MVDEEVCDLWWIAPMGSWIPPEENNIFCSNHLCVQLGFHFFKFQKLNGVLIGKWEAKFTEVMKRLICVCAYYTLRVVKANNYDNQWKIINPQANAVKSGCIEI